MDTHIKSQIYTLLRLNLLNLKFRYGVLSQVMWSGKLAQKRPENSPGKLQGQTLRFFVKLLYWGNDKPVSTKHIWQSKNNIAKMLSIPLRVVNSIL